MSEISLFQISKLCLFLCLVPKNINSHLLFVQLFLVSDSVPYRHRVGGLGSLYRAFFFQLLCFVGSAPTPAVVLG